MKVIDDQFHIIPPNYIKALEARGKGFIGGVEPPTWDPERALGIMDQYGIDMAIGCLSEPGVYFDGDLEWARELARMYNEYCADLVKKYPDKFRCMGTLPMPSVNYSIEEVDYIFDTLKLSAVVMLSNIQGTYLGDPAYDPIFEALDRHHATVFIHPMLPAENSRTQIGAPPWAMDFPFETTRTMTHLIQNGTLDRYPNIKFVLAHLGGTLPFLAQRLDLYRDWTGMNEKVAHDMSWYLQKMYFSSELTYGAANFACVEKFAGYDHILCGCDYPFAQEYCISENMEAIRRYFGHNEDMLAAVMGGNAMQVYMNMA